MHYLRAFVKMYVPFLAHDHILTYHSLASQYSIDRKSHCMNGHGSRDCQSGYVNETKRVYSVLNKGLRDRHYLVGPGKGTYSIADMNCFPHINRHANGGIDSLDEWPGLKAWIGRVAAREQVQSGLNLPPAS